LQQRVHYPNVAFFASDGSEQLDETDEFRHLLAFAAGGSFHANENTDRIV